jgi:hypothetical protein
MASVPDSEKANEDGTAPSLAEAILALSKAISPKPAAPSQHGLLKFLKGLAETLLPSMVMFALGYIFIQGIELDLKREEFTASAADKLKTYVETLMISPLDTPTEQLQATGLALGGFGGVAAYPLVSIIESGGEHRIDAARSGLKQAGRIAPESTCTILAAVIDDTTNAYVWKTRKTIADVAGFVGCDEAKQPLKRLQMTIADMDVLSSEQKNNFEKVVDDALARIEAASSRRSERW